MKRFMKGGIECIQLEKHEVKECLALIAGSAKPSDFGDDFTGAALLLSCFAGSLEQSLDKAASASPYNIRARESIVKARELAGLWGEAGKLSGEWGEDNTSET
jgi:hypothetical protein